MRIALGLLVIGITLGLVSTVGFLSGPTDIGQPESLVDDTSSTLDTPPTTFDTPDPAPSVADEDPVPLWLPNVTSELGAFSEPATLEPVHLQIEALGIDATVGAYGVDSDGRMDVPGNITEVGWYKFGPSPGDPGSAVMAAHVDLAGPGRGLFYDLEDLGVGDVVVVGFSDKSAASFEVVARATYLKTELPLDEIFREEGNPVLTLVTCGGGFSSSRRSYDSNVVVYAVPVDDMTAPATAA